ncbi:hypothetical protein, partial [Stenotrophomonas acidaminiphila]|uniref:hypothetical protein n=1 Tax=Stenotrophomonas acidaminiphila TaxID=128780 RepID=UPI000B247BA8
KAGRSNESQIYAWEQVEQFVGLYLADTDRDKLDPILDTCVEEYKNGRRGAGYGHQVGLARRRDRHSDGAGL